ncbi:MAG: hypothetical protein AzoDbin1_03165 [Azoarcus sp.]|uniref:Uncharacterized protein n=1 Tax=Aromatoleum tolulyticum TaxID=34027 RepID=A0A1N6T5V1_9RHOO|nr:hypothetical protein [Aromatoleum tolulyticum]MCK9986693.1 hypothetical protein [Azoarcus sp.]SIQ48785.1 hypothetical protein SAMN05421829_104339 [Aromatoleum tolulyticum]
MANLHFANFVCRSDKQVFLDFAEVIVPAIEKGAVRKYGDSQYILKDCAVINLASKADVPDIVLAGRIIHNTVLVREQHLVDGEIVKDRTSLPSAPSAIFVLMFDTHRLIYAPETKGAPSLQALRATIHRAIRDRWNAYLREKKAEIEKSTEKQITLKQLREDEPEPKLTILPLSNESSIEKFLEGFSVLRQVKLELVKPNDEIDSMEWLKATREIGGDFGASDTSVTYANTTGLNIEGAATRIAEMTENGNTDVSLRGLDSNGDQLTGNNDHFKITIPAENIPTDIKTATPKLVSIFREKVAEGLIYVPTVTAGVKSKLRRIGEFLSL